MADPRIRTIKIKTGVVKRITRDKIEYEKEAEEQKEKVERLKMEGRDEFELKRQQDVLQECLMMIPDSKRRLVKACEDLENVLKKEKDLKDAEEYAAAQKILKDAKPHLPGPGEVLHFC